MTTPPFLIPEDMYAAPAPDGTCDCRSLHEIRHEIEEAIRNGQRPTELWAAYHRKRFELEQQRDNMRLIYRRGAVELGQRIARLRGVVVQKTEADDFGRAEVVLTVDGVTLWTRPVALNDPQGYRRIRDAIAARRREDWDRARPWLAREAPWRRTVEWGGYEQVRFGENQYGTKWWPT